MVFGISKAFRHFHLDSTKFHDVELLSWSVVWCFENAHNDSSTNFVLKRSKPLSHIQLYVLLFDIWIFMGELQCIVSFKSFYHSVIIRERLRETQEIEPGLLLYKSDVRKSQNSIRPIKLIEIPSKNSENCSWQFPLPSVITGKH